MQIITILLHSNSIPLPCYQPSKSATAAEYRYGWQRWTQDEAPPRPEGGVGINQ